MPYSLEAEESLLGNIMIYPDAMRQAVEAGLFGEDFYFDKHRKIFAIMYTMYEKKENIDTISLRSRLKDYDYFDNNSKIIIVTYGRISINVLELSDDIK